MGEQRTGNGTLPCDSHHRRGQRRRL